MSRSIRIEYELRREMPATLEAAEKFSVEFRRHSVALMSPMDSFASELLLREALNNAIVHGCRNDPGKRLRCCVRFKGRSLLIVVDDDGDGFDWRSACIKQARISDSSGRGVEILGKHANHFRYNDRGNAVTIIKRFR